MSKEEARIALLQEYGSNARNWYSVLLGLAIVFFTVVQVRDELRTLGLFQVTLWAVSLAVMFSQTAYVLIRAIVHNRFAETVVDVDARSNGAEGKNYLKVLREKTTEKIIAKRRWKFCVWLGTLKGWAFWTILTVPIGLIFLVFFRV